MAEDDTEELRSEQAARKEAAARLAKQARSPEEADQHARRAEQSAYLEEKLAERAESEDE
jgi:hypothetical protein